jgi:hypothetical protein
MKKNQIKRFISKYNLNGLIRTARWIKENDVLRVSAMDAERRLLAGVALHNFTGLDYAQIAILDTGKLLALLNGMASENISVKLQKDESGEKSVLTFSSATSEVMYLTGLVDVTTVPSLKRLPRYNIQIQLSDDFRRLFFKACVALGRDALFTIGRSRRTNKPEVVLSSRHYPSSSDRIFIQADLVKYKPKGGGPVYFSAKYLKEILKANSECKDPLLKVSEAGLASIHFSQDDLDSEYHLVKMYVEDGAETDKKPHAKVIAGK